MEKNPSKEPKVQSSPPKIVVNGAVFSNGDDALRALAARHNVGADVHQQEINEDCDRFWTATDQASEMSPQQDARAQAAIARAAATRADQQGGIARIDGIAAKFAREGTEGTYIAAELLKARDNGRHHR